MFDTRQERSLDCAANDAVNSAQSGGSARDDDNLPPYALLTRRGPSHSRTSVSQGWLGRMSDAVGTALTSAAPAIRRTSAESVRARRPAVPALGVEPRRS